MYFETGNISSTAAISDNYLASSIEIALGQGISTRPGGLLKVIKSRRKAYHFNRFPQSSFALVRPILKDFRKCTCRFNRRNHLDLENMCCFTSVPHCMHPF